MYRWCVVSLGSDLWNIPTPVDQFCTAERQDRRIVRAVVVVVAARTAFREEIRAHVEPAVSPRTIGIRLLAAELRSRVPLARLPLTPRHREARLLWCRERVDLRVQWRSVVYSDEKQVLSACE